MPLAPTYSGAWPAVAVGQVWAAPKTGYRWKVVEIRPPYVSAECLDGPLVQDPPLHVGANSFTFHRSAFADGSLEFDRSTTWTREEVEAFRAWRRPRVRCRFGTGGEDFKDYTGEIVPDGNNPWVFIRPDPHGKEIVESRFSWGLVLEVLNDPRAAPLWFWKR